jgi:hypothetical protein
LKNAAEDSDVKRLVQNSEGAVATFKVEPVKDRVDNPVDAAPFI